MRGHRYRRLLLVAGWALVAACPSPSDSPHQTRSPSVGPPGSGAKTSRKLGHVGNQASGIDAMPDYDAPAAALRDRMSARLPDPLPSPKAACKEMLDEAVRFYRDTEGDGSSSLAAIERARTLDEATCRTETSPAAATCVTILLRGNAGEYPWLVDQCSRAFPSS